MEAVLKKEIIINKTLCRLIGVLLFVFLTALGAFIRLPLPFTPVPVTLQTFFVLLSGAFLGAGLGAVSQLGYILLGATGLSLFAGFGSGTCYLCGPTAGYLVGFVLASFLIGTFSGSAKSTARLFALLCIGDLLLLGCGALWLKLLLGLSPKKAFLWGVLPFIPADMLKAWMAALLYARLRTRATQIF
ncbi:MAG TPA: biotin transporter BioY [Patescibacteria group bacterium]|nr:biotin transporter BioY [Patescibacteria group bacterium]